MKHEPADLSFVPDHVPPEKVWPYDLNVYARSLEDPFEIGSHMRKCGDIVYTRGTRGQAGWVATRFELMKEIYMDTERFSSKGNSGVQQLLGVEWGLNPLDYDPPQHMVYRQIMQPLFMPAAINRYESMIRAIACELMERFANMGRCDFMTDFAIPFPSFVFLDLAGLPRDMLPQFFKWEHAFIRGSTPAERIGGLVGIKQYLEEYIERHHNDCRENLISTIVNGEIKGQPLSRDEIMGMCMVIYLGGLDTVLSSLGWHMRYLAMNSALQDQLKQNPEKIAAAVDDLYRAYGVTMTRRYVSRDISFSGVLMKEGDRVLMPTYIASRDPEQFKDPQHIDPERKARSLTFATGPHNCIGAHLARRESRIVIEEFLSRFNNIRIDNTREQGWQTDGVWSMTNLPLIWD